RYTEVGYHGDDVENIISDLFKKTKSEFYKNFSQNFWKLKSVKLAWESFILTFYLGINYKDHPLYNLYKDKLHSGDLDNAEVEIWIKENAIERYKISEIKKTFYREGYDKLSTAIDF